MQRWDGNRIHVPNQWMFVQLVVITVAVFGLFELHPIAIRIDVTLAMFASLFDEYLFSIHGAHKAFVSADVAAFRVYVHDIFLMPLTQALVFAFWKFKRKKLISKNSIQ